MKRVTTLLLCAACALVAQAQKTFTLGSPDGKLQTTVTVGDQLTYDITLDGRQILAPSPLGMTLENGAVWGEHPKLAGTARQAVDASVPSPFYRADALKNQYNELTLRFQKDWSVEFRAYNDGIAYRFVSKAKKPFNVKNETVDYRFLTDAKASVPYVGVGKDGDYESQYFNSFENTYTTDHLSKLNKQRLMFLPLVVEAADGVKLCITESDLENYPGLYFTNAQGDNRLTGQFAPYPKREEQGGHNRLQMVVREREPYIAKVDKPRSFPWRMAIVTTSDKDLANSNLTYLLASPSRLADTSWIRPGKVAWDWWNDWNIYGVDFESGINNDTYKAYIDFASAKGIEYVILDEGWAVNLQADLMQVVPSINLKELVDYAAARHVGIILWAGYYAFERDMENVCRHYAEMGVKGFKVDFMDRDDQEMTTFNYRAAAMAAKYKLLLDLHGTHKPAGLNRTYPNVLNFEGVFGLEQLKWIPATHNQVQYDVMIPFLRQVAGPLDYTQGAMHNASKGNYYPSNSEPMSQGTRCHQLGLYMVFDSPFSMLCDSPSNYEREPESTAFISEVPTVWDETRVLEGKMGEYIVTARRKGDTWYVGGITNWIPRDLELDCPFLVPGRTYHATLFRDGANAHRKGIDYRREEFDLTQDGSLKLKLHLAPGGGFALKLR
ncbi:MAG: glycoside hydrolase family 97 protein [Mediterranea sp.]|jgi:alpha-glucosidase|nr:glycoside hydrolase family 97 protein [Mediterranea sp.]